MAEKKQYILVDCKKIRNLRSNKGFKQAELGQKIGLSRQTINSWEKRDSVKVDIKIFNLILLALNVKPYDLTHDRNPDAKNQAEQGNVISELARSDYRNDLIEALKRENSLLREMLDNGKKNRGDAANVA